MAMRMEIKKTRKFECFLNFFVRNFTVSIAGVCQNMVFLLWNSDFWVFHSWAIDPELVCHQWNTYDLTLQVFHSWAILQFHSWDKSVP